MTTAPCWWFVRRRNARHSSPDLPSENPVQEQREMPVEEIECFHDQRTRTGHRSADGRVAAIGVAEHARAPRRSEGTVPKPCLSPEGTAGGQARRGPRRGGPSDRAVAGRPGIVAVFYSLRWIRA